MRLEIEVNDRIYDHGEIKIIRNDYQEKTIKAEINLVISGDLVELKEELEALIKKYAI